tara:strand:- start:904 stop:1062 length:159 start_codon:yes stop_codon:yes gene_type:complete
MSNSLLLFQRQTLSSTTLRAEREGSHDGDSQLTAFFVKERLSMGAERNLLYT